MLLQAHKNLECDGLVTRAAYPTVPVTMEYAISPLGQTLKVTPGSLRQLTIDSIGTVLGEQYLYDEKRCRARQNASRAPF